LPVAARALLLVQLTVIIQPQHATAAAMPHRALGSRRAEPGIRQRERKNDSAMSKN
jgi:hypothetical protein